MMTCFPSKKLILVGSCFLLSLFLLTHHQCAGWPMTPTLPPRPAPTIRLHEKSGDNQSSPTITTRKTIQNFRQAAGISNIYRCASLDVLGGIMILDDVGFVDTDADGVTSSMGVGINERFTMEQVGLVLDLRSPSERQEELSRAWIEKAGMKLVVEDVERSDRLLLLFRPNITTATTTTSMTTTSTIERCVVRIDVLSPSRFMNYIEENWLTPTERAQATWFKLVNGRKLHELRIEKLNARGLFGLNEAILETGKREICRALVTITEYLEHNPGQSAMIHCVQGKDRTGMVVMLLQSILGVSDVDIVADYFKSNEMLVGTDVGSAAAATTTTTTNKIRPRGKLDRNFFSGTNEQAMISTLHFLREKYGSVSPGYLDSIEFDQGWRNRLASVLIPAGELQPSSRL